MSHDPLESFDIDAEADRVIARSDAVAEPVPVTIGGRKIVFQPLMYWPYEIHEKLAEGDLIEAFRMALGPEFEDDAEFIRKQPAARVVALAAYLNKVSGVSPEDFSRSARRSGSIRKR